MELATKTDEAKKLKGRVTTLKSNVQRLESLSKKPLGSYASIEIHI